ncbi:polysaccharide biosynthesis/export family protein [Rhizobium binxianense]
MKAAFSFARTARIAARRSAIPLMVSVGLAISSFSVAAADEYRLGVMDKLRIRVAEWQTAEGSIRDWSAVSGDYTVGPTGTVSLPFIGELPASGQTTGAIAEQIGQKLQQQFGLRDRPSASVELAEFRPLFLTGDIDQPGQYPYTPNLTVSKAVALAGGLRRADPGQRFARDFLNAKGDGAIALAERNRLLIKRARLQAEIAGQNSFDVPEELKNQPGVDKMMASEAALLDTREKRLTLQLQALADLKSLLQSEVNALAQKSETQTRQLELAKEDRDKIEDLAERGLALSARKMQSEQRAADLEATLLDIDTNSLRAKQDISQANQNEITLRNDRDAQLAQDLQNTQAQLDELELKIGTSTALMSEALAQSADAARFDEANGTQVSYFIVREQGGQSKEIQAQENTLVLPGDLIKVTSAVAMR